MSFFLINARLYLAIGPLLALWNVLFGFVTVWADVEGGGAVAVGGESSSDEEMEDVEVLTLYVSSFGGGVDPGVKAAIEVACEDLERMVGFKAIFWKELEGNSCENDAELDILVRKALKKTG